MGEFPSGQRGQTVNLLAMPSVVRIHLPPPSKTLIRLDWRFAYPEVDSKGAVLENMPVACFPRDPARPQAGESTFPHQAKRSSVWMGVLLIRKWIRRERYYTNI